jgi:HK97 family phage portal protein
MSDKQQGLIKRTMEALAGLKGAIRFPGRGGATSTDTGPIWDVLGPRWAHSGSINYASEVGDLGGASLVMAAVNWLGRVLPEAPLNVVETDVEGMESPLPNHPAAKLWRRPNHYYSGTTLCKAYGYSWILSGNPYFLKARNKAGVVSELWYIPPHMMRPVWLASGEEFISGYEYKVDGRTITFEQNDVIHFRDGIDPLNMRLGLSPVASVMREIYTDQEIASYSALLMKNGAVPPVVISLKEGINALGVDTNAIREKYLSQTQGDERGKAWVSGLAINVEKVGFSPSDLNLAQLRRLPEERLSAVMGIPAIVLGYGAGLDKATYSNARQLVEYATESYLVPLYRYIEEELTTQLLPDFEGENENISFRFDLSAVRALSEDMDALYNRLTIGYKGGWLKRSEARELAGYEWGPEDEVYAPSSPGPGDMFGAGEDDMGNVLDFPPKRKPPLEAEAAGLEPGGVEQKRTDPDTVGSDAVLDSAIPWLLALGEREVAEMIRAKPKRAIAHE